MRFGKRESAFDWFTRKDHAGPVLHLQIGRQSPAYGDIVAANIEERAAAIADDEDLAILQTAQRHPLRVKTRF